MGCLQTSAVGACPAPSLTAGIHCKAASLAMSNLHFFWKWLAPSKPVLLGFQLKKKKRGFSGGNPR